MRLGHPSAGLVCGVHKKALWLAGPGLKAGRASTLIAMRRDTAHPDYQRITRWFHRQQKQGLQAMGGMVSFEQVGARSPLRHCSAGSPFATVAISSQRIADHPTCVCVQSPRAAIACAWVNEETRVRLVWCVACRRRPSGWPDLASDGPRTRTPATAQSAPRRPRYVVRHGALCLGSHCPVQSAERYRTRRPRARC